MVANLSKNPVIKTPEKGKGSSVENTSITSLSSPTTQFFSKEGSDNIDLPNSGSKTLNSVQLFGKIENHQNNPSSSRVLNSSPSFPPIQRKGSTDHSPKTAPASNKTGLPDNLKSGIEALSGFSMDNVRVHYNSPNPAQLQAHAYAQGTDIHVASGQEKHVPHEAWHVVQQRQGRVQATKQMKGKVPVNDDAGLEKEADVMGAKALQMKVVESDPLNIPKSENASKQNTPAQLAPKEGEQSEIEEPELDESFYFQGANKPDKDFQYTRASLPTGIKNNLDADADPEGLFSAVEGKRHDMFTKASKILTGKKDVDEFYKENPSYGIIGGGKASQPGIPSEKTEEDESDKAIGRLAPMFMKQPEAGAMTIAYHVATGELNAKGVAARIDGKFHNEAGRFGGGFHVASDIATGALEVDHHKNDWKKENAKKAKDEGKSLEEQEAAYNETAETKPTNHLKYQVNLSGGDIVDATGPLTAMVINRPKEIERAAREDNKDGILFKSSRGSGNNLVLYKNYKSVVTLENKENALKTPDKFTAKDEMDRESMRNAPATEEEKLLDINPTTKISNKLSTAHP